MSRNRIIQLVSFAASVACLVVAIQVGGPIAQQRQELQLAGFTTKEALPPAIALTQAALGSFRGLAVDVMWYRATKLKDAGQYREANQLSEWICALQPRFERVWVFHAWNMAYNISVATHTPEERWDWVNKGIRLLRDKALVANPNSVYIAKELAWIFFHKIGAMSDDMHWYYRRKLAQEWQEVLGSPGVYDETKQISEVNLTHLAIEHMRSVAEAPDSLEELLEDEGVARLIKRFATLPPPEGRMFPRIYAPDEKLLRAIGKTQMLLASKDKHFLSLNVERLRNFVDVRVYHVTLDPELASGFGKLLPYLRKKVLVKRYHMDPQEMLRLMEKYGPMDWRHPAAHSAYWAEQGIKAAIALRNKQDVDQLNTDRLIVHSMQTLAGSGRLTYDPMSGYLDMLPDPRFIESYKTALEDAGARTESGDWGTRSKFVYYAGYENFLLRSVTHSYLYGDEKAARKYHQEWREEFQAKRGNEDRLKLSIEHLVIEELVANSTIPENRRQIMDAFLRRAFFDGMAKGRRGVFEKYLKLAQESHDLYRQKDWRNPEAERDRMAWDGFRKVLLSTYQNLMEDNRTPLLLRARIWVRTDPALRRPVFDLVSPNLEEQARRSGLDPQRLFPEPPGMKEYRAKNALGAPKSLGAPDTPKTIERK